MVGAVACDSLCSPGSFVSVSILNSRPTVPPVIVVYCELTGLIFSAVELVFLSVESIGKGGFYVDQSSHLAHSGFLSALN